MLVTQVDISSHPVAHLSITPKHSRDTHSPDTLQPHTPRKELSTIDPSLPFEWFIQACNYLGTHALALCTFLSSLHALTCGSPQTCTDGGGNSCHGLDDSKSPCPHPLRFRGVRHGEPHLRKTERRGRGEERREETRRDEERRGKTRRGESLLH